MKNIFLLSLALLLSSIVVAQTQSSDQTSGQHNPAAQSGSNLPQTDVKPNEVHPAGAPKTATPPAAQPSSAAAESANKSTTEEPDPYLDVPPMPSGPVSMVGGVVKNVDHIRNHMTLTPFGAKPMKITFDERTHIYRDGIETTNLGIHKGDRAYVDTQLDNGHIFARNVHVVTDTEPADARGQIVEYNHRNGNITIRDELSSQPVSFRVDSSTQVRAQSARGSAGDLVPGALVAIRFAPGTSNRGIAKEVAVLAKPGTSFKFYGQLTHLDVSNGVMVIRNVADGKAYEINFNPDTTPERSMLRVGGTVAVDAQFNGRGYEATHIQITQTSAKE